jgi:GAF domain-containing protein
VLAAKQLFMVEAAGIMLADNDGTLRSARASDQRAQTLEDSQERFAAGPCAQAFATGRPVVMRDATLEPRWGEVRHAFAEARIRSGLSVPLRLGGCPIGTLDVYAAAPGGWDETEVSALQAYAGVVATLLGAAARATVRAGWPSSSRPPWMPAPPPSRPGWRAEMGLGMGLHGWT